MANTERTLRETINALKEQISLLSKRANETGKLSISEAKLLNSLRKQLKTRQSLSRVNTNILDNQFKARDIEAQMANNILRGGKARTLIVKLQQQHVNLIKNSLSGELELSDIEEHKLDIKEAQQSILDMLTGSNIKLRNELLDQLDILREQHSNLVGQNEISKSISEIQEKQNEIYESSFGWLSNIKKQANSYIAALKTQQGRMLLLKTAGLAVAAGIATMVNSMREFADETGLGYGQLISLSPAIAIAGDEARSLIEEFGGLQNVTTKTLLTMKLLSFQYGISADSTARLLGVMESISDKSRDVLLSQIKSTAELARSAGVAPAAVMEDLAENTELFALYGKDGGDNIRKAAIEARKLGLSLSSLSSSAETLLDFEGSIEAQMEASILLGRELNLDKARQLAFMGDMTGLSKELVSLVGTESEFNKLNVIQRKALADSLGLSVMEVTKLVREQEKSIELSNSWYGTLTKITTAISESKVALMGVAGIMGSIALASAVALANKKREVALSAIQLIKEKAKLALSAASAVASAFMSNPILGALLAASIIGTIYGTYSKFKSVDDVVIPPGGATAITGPAGSFSLNPNDSVIAGTDLLPTPSPVETNINVPEINIPPVNVSTSTTDKSSVIDVSKTNSLLSQIVNGTSQLIEYNKKLLDQNEKLMYKLTQRVKDLSMV